MKKTTFFKSILFTITFILFISTHAQILRTVNQEWVTTGGSPNEHYEYISGAGANGFIYIVGSTYRSNQQDNFFIAKIVDDGTIYWIKEFNSLTNYRDFGIDIVAKDTLIYVTGMSWDSISGTSQIVTLRLDDNNGNIVWSQNWGSRYNVPVKITADNNGNVYVGGTAETSASEFAMVVLKYSPSGSLDWASTYDSIGVIDGAIALVLDSPQNYLTITGYSGNGFNNWDFTTVQMDVNTGNIKNTTITQNGNGGFNKPVGISGNGTTTYIGGTVTHPTTGKKRMKIIGYDYQWQEVNLSYYGDSLTETEAIDMHNDFTGANVLLATHTRTDGHKEIIITRYALSDGSLLWDRTLSAPSGEDAEAGSFTIAGDANNIYLTGSIKSASGRHRMLTAAYDLDGNLMWMKEYNRTATSDDRGKTVDADVDGNPVTTGVSIDNDTSTYVSVKYISYEKPKQFVLDDNNKPAYLKNRVLVKFNENSVNQSVLSDRDKRVFSPVDLLTTAAYNLLKSMLSIDFDKSTFSCLTSLTPEDKFSTSRLGEQVKIPPLWAAFAFDFPEPVSRTEVDIATDLNALFPVVIYAHPDYAGHLDQGAADPLYSLKQGSLHPVPMWDSAHINVETAWNYSVGESFVKVGVIDDGIKYLHPEFGGNPPLSKVKGGTDWTNNGSPWDYYSSPNQNVTGHGTQVAGIIGALRNNSQGVAGIAGGDGGSNQGVTLFAMKIFPSGLDTIGVVSHAYQAIVDNVVEHTTHPNGLYWGVHIFNGSFGFDKNSTYKDSTILLLEDAIHFANRNQVTYVASRGNNPSTEDFHFPAIFWDDWVLSVGASGFDGKPATFNSTNCTQLMTQQGGFTPSFGRGMDVIAPAGKCIVQTAVNNSNVYEGFSGTSASAPHAAGVAALLMSHHNQPTANFNNLAPEDVEGILETTASFREQATKPSALSGWGLIDAGKAMEFAWKPKYTLEHVCSYGVDAVIPNAYVWNKTINLTRRTQSHNGQWVDAGKYIVDLYDLVKTKQIFASTTSKHQTMWSVHSLSDTYIAGLFGNDLNPIESVSCCEVISNLTFDTLDATYSGNIFHVRDSLTGAHIAWLPYDTAYAKDSARMCISVLSYDSTVNSIHEVRSGIKGIDIAVFPNPSNEYNTVLIDVTQKLDMKVELFDITGTFIRDVWEGPAAIGNHKITHEVGDLPSGLYFYRVQAGEKQLTKRFLKL